MLLGLSGDEFKFNKSTGDGPARYNIIHYKQVSVGKYDWVTVGDFHDGDIFLNMSGKIILYAVYFFYRRFRCYIQRIPSWLCVVSHLY